MQGAEESKRSNMIMWDELKLDQEVEARNHEAGVWFRGVVKEKQTRWTPWAPGLARGFTECSVWIRTADGNIHVISDSSTRIHERFRTLGEALDAERAQVQSLKTRLEMAEAYALSQAMEQRALRAEASKPDQNIVTELQRAQKSESELIKFGAEVRVDLGLSSDTSNDMTLKCLQTMRTRFSGFKEATSKIAGLPVWASDDAVLVNLRSSAEIESKTLDQVNQRLHFQTLVNQIREVFKLPRDVSDETVLGHAQQLQDALEIVKRARDHLLNERNEARERGNWFKRQRNEAREALEQIATECKRVLEKVAE